MALRHPLNLFYAEREADRWLPLDRYPRRWLRRILRGPPMIGGQKRVFLNLCAGLDRIGVPYRVNDYRHLRRHPHELICVLGKRFLINEIHAPNPMIFGPAGVDHPIEDPRLLERLPVRMVMVPGEWVRQMFSETYGDAVVAWPVGIDVDHWTPAPASGKDLDFILYDKVRWRHDEFEPTLLEPVRRALYAAGQSFETIRYGYYKESDFRRLLDRARGMVFLCEHETQGIAYQQALACGVPILAWDRGGYWQDPQFYPARVQYQSDALPVSSVPYWDDRCGVKFADATEFSARLAEFLERRDTFRPRDYVVENLTLETCARWFVDLVERAQERG